MPQSGTAAELGPFIDRAVAKLLLQMLLEQSTTDAASPNDLGPAREASKTTLEGGFIHFKQRQRHEQSTVTPILFRVFGDADRMPNELAWMLGKAVHDAATFVLLEPNWLRTKNFRGPDYA